MDYCLKKIFNFKFLILNLRRRGGFSLIELLVVITLFAITSIAVTISYISYEGQTQVKNAALGLKSDLRLAQNNAQTGNIVDSTSCSRDNLSTLVGWYVVVSKNATSYEVAGDCALIASPFTESKIGSKTSNLPSGVSVLQIAYGSTCSAITSTAVLFRPLNYASTYFNTTTGWATLPSFYGTGTNVVKAGLSGVSPDELVITVSSGDGVYEVHIAASGDIYEKQVGTAAVCS